MGLRPAKSHEKPTADADWADGGADPWSARDALVPLPEPTISASCRAPAGRRGRRPRTRGSAPPFPGLVSRTCPLLVRLHLGFGAEHGNRFDFDQQFRTAKNRLDPGGSRHGLEFLLAVKLRAFLVECLVIPLDIAQVAGGAHDIVPGGAFGFQ